MRAQFRVKTPGKGVETGFGGGVYRPTRPGTSVTRAGHVDDLPKSLLLELRGKGTAAHDGTGKIQVNNLAIDLIIHFLDGSHFERAAGVVDQEINPAKRIQASLSARVNVSSSWSRQPLERRPSNPMPCRHPQFP